jgi:hypothetical protein
MTKSELAMCPKCQHYSAIVPIGFMHMIYCNICFSALERHSEETTA